MYLRTLLTTQHIKSAKHCGDSLCLPACLPPAEARALPSSVLSVAVSPYQSTCVGICLTKSKVCDVT